MNEKKNIDRLFQEKFKDFEVTPPDFVWDNIQSRLEEKKKRRIVPLWFRLSGVAAVLVAGMFVLSPYLGESGDSNSNSVVKGVEGINPDGTKRIEPTDNPIRPGGKINEEAVASGGEPSGSKTSLNNGAAPAIQQEAQDKGSYKQQRNIIINEAVAADIREEEKRSRNQGNRTIVNENTTPAERTAAAHEKIVDNRNNNAIANTPANNAKGAPVDKQPDRAATNDFVNKNVSPLSPEQGVAVNNPAKGNDNILPEGNHNITGNGENNTRNNVVVPQEIKTDEAVAQIEAVMDTAAIAEPENELEKALREKLNGNKEEEKAIAESNRKGKWNIKPQMAPLFFNTASEGSPIDANLAANSKDFDNDLSYGVGIDYAITDRISIRSGINTVNMRYSTNDVEFYASLNDEGFSSVVQPAGPNANLVVNPAGSAPVTDNFSTQTFDGSLVQKIGFVEVPLEISYKLLNRKFGIDLIGGVSTLFLSDNNVSVVSEQGFNSNMGEARNINNVSFSTNVGVGFKYKIIQSLEASFEPMFKYQLNTFSNNSGNFKPYFIGLYSGISFSF